MPSTLSRTKNIDHFATFSQLLRLFRNRRWESTDGEAKQSFHHFYTTFLVLSGIQMVHSLFARHEVINPSIVVCTFSATLPSWMKLTIICDLHIVSRFWPVVGCCLCLEWRRWFLIFWNFTRNVLHVHSILCCCCPSSTSGSSLTFFALDPSLLRARIYVTFIVRILTKAVNLTPIFLGDSTQILELFVHLQRRGEGNNMAPVLVVNLPTSYQTSHSSFLL